MLSRPHLAVGMHGIIPDLTPLPLPSRLRGIGQHAPGVIVGQLRAPWVKALKALARPVGVSEEVKLTGCAEEAIIPALHRGASVDVLASRHARLGFPAVETLACGAPTTTSAKSSFDEVAGDDALIER